MDRRRWKLPRLPFACIPTGRLSSSRVNITVVELVEALLGGKALDKPADVFGRDTEWADLADFALSPLPGLRIAVVYGRRRQGKSYLLRRLTGAVGELYDYPS